jgi:DNA repair protein RadC
MTSSSFQGPRERALDQGVDRLSDADLVSLLLGTGTAAQPVGLLAATLLERAGGLPGVARLGPAALADCPGLGWAKALRLSAGLELGRRSVRTALEPRTPLRSSAHVADLLTARIAHLDHEEMWVVSLDGRSAARSARRVAQGGLHGLSVSARDILRVALLDAASAIVLAHNHPSGDPTPSPEDIAMTRAVAEAAEVVGTPLVDHVIISSTGYRSMLDLGLIDPTLEA